MVQTVITIDAIGDPIFDLIALNSAINEEGPKGAFIAAQRIVIFARQKARKKSGKMAASIRASFNGRDALVSFGGGEVDYHLFQEYGTIYLKGPGYSGSQPGMPGYNDGGSYPFMRPAIDEVINSGMGASLIQGEIDRGYRKKQAASGGFAAIARNIVGGGSYASGGNPLKNLKAFRNPVSTSGPIKGVRFDALGMPISE